jgi:hypothetical protein
MYLTSAHRMMQRRGSRGVLRVQLQRSGGQHLNATSEMLASLSELLASPSEMQASPSEMLASPSELSASPSELSASPQRALSVNPARC